MSRFNSLTISIVVSARLVDEWTNRKRFFYYKYTNGCIHSCCTVWYALFKALSECGCLFKFTDMSYRYIGHTTVCIVCRNQSHIGLC